MVGTTCAGKTTLARHLAGVWQFPHIELDALNWDPGWTMPSAEEFRARVSAALAGLAWVADGNYSKARDIIWSRADTLIWLDYPLRVIVPRLLSRTFRRIVTRQELWNGNRETLRAVLGRDSLFLYAFTSHRRRRQTYPPLIAHYDHLHAIHLRTPRATRGWLADVTATAPAGGVPEQAR